MLWVLHTRESQVTKLSVPSSRSEKERNYGKSVKRSEEVGTEDIVMFVILAEEEISLPVLRDQ